MGKSSGGSGVVIIKKYANRRLYDTDSSSYITLEHLAVMTRAGREFKVIDAKSEEDITHNVLTQIIMEEETRGQTMLPVGFLRQLIGLYGDNMQSMVPQYLEASMDAFKRNQLQFRSAMEGAFSGGPFAEIAKRNLEMFEAAASAFKPPLVPGGPLDPETKDANGEAVPAVVNDEIAALKEQVAALQARIDTHRS
ncbi:polyhydroxyalkanoate synthesis repressor PhaR [Sphingomonas prati]|uniref:Polyhydroxyalkanoate synthesis repressor PhaR n=1 Tax=Sphingomonas prati TaxID=1843237 RepID=A0A7W9BTX6_9SPHN|nr:polyhydroxyalkanoate synthesis repressor PhaR [Sphingomonas prati]MBB5730064.1 polyhydroxyalkanoate synthesis repressor PhaR [Sphingomonas prati]GGE91171.1 polyhydroxyalkanoate synthesis repressor PhaR [Sphingomonas prati]